MRMSTFYEKKPTQTNRNEENGLIDGKIADIQTLNASRQRANEVKVEYKMILKQKKMPKQTYGRILRSKFYMAMQMKRGKTGKQHFACAVASRYLATTKYDQVKDKTLVNDDKIYAVRFKLYVFG